MGSSGTGRLSDYPGSSSGGSGASGGSGGTGPRGSDDRCSKAFSSKLDDVAMSDYYVGTKRLPPVGTNVVVAKRKRVVVQTANGESIGSLPTAFNYLAGCLADGWTYAGVVRVSQEDRLGPTVIVDITPVTP